MQMVSVALLTIALTGADAPKCPISGKEAKNDVFLDINGKKVNFCCGDCLKTYSKKISLADEGPKKCCVQDQKEAKAETKLIHQKAEAVYFCCEKCPKGYAEKEKLASVDKGPGKCPLSGKEAKADFSVSVNGEKTYFCCDKCRGKYLKDLAVVDKGPEKCPVSDHAAKKENMLIRVKSEAVYFCCNNCREKYIAKNFKQEEKKEKDKAKID